MPTASGNKDQYDEMAAEYKGYTELPMYRLEAELIRRALGDCTGLAVLDLGGGSGTHARQAIKAGARTPGRRGRYLGRHVADRPRNRGAGV
jgi:hypothetical protein